MGYSSFEDLEVWQKSCRLTVRVYEILSEVRDYGLKDQMTRAAVSIPSNIAEGSERDSSADFIRFLNFARGSAAELRTQVYIGSRIGIINDNARDELVEELKTISSKLYALIKSISTRP